MGHFGVVAKLQPSFLDIGARDVQLERTDLGVRGKFLNDLNEFLDRLAEDVGNDVAIARFQLGQFFTDEGVYPNIFEADGVQHSGRRLNDPARSIAGRGVQRQPLGAKPAQFGDVKKSRKLHTIPKGS